MKRTSQKLVKKKTSQSLKPVKHREDVKHIKSDAVQTTTQESRIIRVFFSSPFRGLEMEREELAKTYWPRLSSMCSKAGYEFVPVDLRWGITSEKMSNAGTVEVCLREIDRSDLFVGFYGQRYGWNGAKDEHLQRNLDVAAIKYPWVNQYRDRSVTEIEFLHGFLNEPGKRTSCFFFRAKAYDEKMVNIHKSTGNTDEVSKYTDEPKAAALLKSLKTQIKTVKEKCCDLVDEYSDPQTGALLMFKAIKKYLEETILAEPAKETSDIQKESLLHEAYYISRLGVGTRRQYVGGERYLKDVDQHVISNVKGFRGKPLLILGDAGFGKTALIANWLHRHKQKYPDDLIAYHFVGCTPKSTSEKDILARLVLQLTLGFNEKFDEVQQVKAQPMKSSLSDGGLHGKLMKLRTRETYDIYRELKDIIAKISENGRRAIIIIDSLNRMDPIHQTKQELYWIPTELPKGVSLIVSTLKNDTTRIKVWTEDRQWDTLEVSSLSSDERHTIIKEMLAMRGKELTPTQVKMVVKKEQTSNALYLEILLKELCNFGDFRKLNDYLNFLLEVKSTKGLFTKVIERLESDFNPPKSKENKVCKVLCSILVSRYGLSDQEIKEITGIPDQLWSAIFFAMEDFFIIRAGLYDFSYDELADAVREKYCQDEEVQRGYISTIAYYYQRKLNELGLQHVIGGKTILRIADELPPLLKQLGYKEKLKHVITNLSIFTSIFSRPDTMYDLYGYLNFTNASGMEISSLFMKSLDKQSDFLKDKKKRTADADTAIATVRDLLAVAYDIAEVMCESGHPHDAVSVLQWAIKLQNEIYENEDVYSDTSMTDLYIGIIDKLAGLYCDLERFADSEELHMKCLAIKESMPGKEHNRKSDVAISLNGLALVYQQQRKYDQAMEYYQRCLQIHQTELPENHRLIGETMNNIGSLLFGMDRFTEAMEYLNSAIKVYEVCYFGTFHPDLAGALNNLAVCYRNLNQMDKAGPLLEQAYEMAVTAFGKKHPDVAERLINLGVYHQHLEMYDKALDMYNKAMDIYKETFGDSHLRTLLVMENIAGAYVLDGKHSQAHRYFKKAGETLYHQGRMDASMPSLNDQMLYYYVNNDRKEEAVGLLERLMDVSFVKPVYFLTLEKLDTALPDDQQRNRQYEYTIEYAITRFPKDQDILEYIIDVTAASGNVDRMLNILKTGKYDCGACNQAFAKYLERGHRREGMKILNYALEISPDEWMTYLNLAMTHAGYQEYDRAIELLRKAIMIEPDILVLRETIAKLLLATGDTEAAKSELQIALKLAKGDKQNVDKIEDLLKKLN